METVESAMSSEAKQVRLPEMRAGVIRALEKLSDPQHQQRIWIERKYPTPGYFDDFSLTLNTLDDAAVLDSPYEAVGYTLASNDEARAMEQLSRCIDEIISAVGKLAPDEAFLASLLWEKVVVAATNALAALTS